MNLIAKARRLPPREGGLIAKQRRLPPCGCGQLAKERRLDKDAGGYTRAIRSCVRGLWTGEWDYDLFYQGMVDAIRFHISQAWRAGAKECGILPAELTKAERVALEQAIQYEFNWIEGYAAAIEEGSKANGGKLGPLMSRSKIWTGRWEGVKSQAMAMACADQKLKWVTGPTEKSCPSCSRLNGKVKRASYWNERGILPRVHGAEYLACHGFRCQCELVPTDEPASKGPLPKLP
jgi:hypothetical protein